MAVVKALLRVSCLLALFLVGVWGQLSDSALQITRHNNGDLFGQIYDPKTVCSEDTCVGASSGTATAISTKELCTCRCLPHLPAFREDLRICVDDIHECVLAPFVGGSTSQQIPFVFLPLKGQIIHPSKEISFAGIQTPVCAVSGAKFLTDNGWVDLRNPLDTDVPFRLFRDEGRTFLQWVGEPELRAKMSGRLVMVYLMCRDLATSEPVESTAQTLFSPCVAFRVVGSPSRYLNNVSEVAFLPDAHSSSSTSNGDRLSISEYIAIGICSVLLGLIYVASVFFYLHIRKRNSSSNDKNSKESKSLTSVEEGIIKNNPLLTMSAHFPPPDNLYSDSNSSDTDVTPDIIQNHEERKKHLQITSALIHPQMQKLQKLKYNGQNFCLMEHSLQDSSSIERLPEEQVSIIETLEGKEDRPDNLKAISSGTVRKKLYFNPAYFEPQLLMSPPPAALEFLAKIREVITIAKQKMATKRFSPSLLGIPEEEVHYAVDPTQGFSKPGSRRSSIISLKRENSRRKTCSGCPGCEPQDFKSLCGKLPEFPALAACQNCCSTTNESKQNSIRKWLENVPTVKTDDSSDLIIKSMDSKVPKRLRSPTRSLPPDKVPERALSPKPASERARSRKSNTRCRKPKNPPPPAPARKPKEPSYYDTVSEEPKRDVVMTLPPPDMIHEAMAVDSMSSEERIPTLTKKQMNAVINELSCQRSLIINENPDPPPPQKPIDYEADSLERTAISKNGYRTPPDYADVSSQPSPSLSSALPLDEEMTMRNAIFNKNTGNMTISKINMDMLAEDEHDYELIVLKKGSVIEPGLYNLPELLQRNNGYSLVSEVYVNNGYNYGSTPTSPGDSNCSTLEKRSLKVRYEECIDKPGKLLIEVEDCPDNYLPVEDSDNFEPDTLDRKPSKLKIAPNKITANEFIDSLERPNQILLRTNGSFRSESVPSITEDNDSGNFQRVFGSLREIYEAKTKGLKTEEEDASLTKISDEEGRILTLEERHSKRQRRNNKVVQPDVIPPPPHDNSPIYEHPKPPRKLIINDAKTLVKPPLPPKVRPLVKPSSETPKSPSSSSSGSQTDYEFCVLQKSKKDGNITSLIQTEDIILKKGGNEHFVFHTSVTPTSYCLPMKSLQSIINPNQINLSKSKFKKTWHLKPKGKHEDSGYLSTDSNESCRKTTQVVLTQSVGGGSETDESLCDGMSESGAESVETHSVFFGSFHRKPDYSRFGSMDSGVIGEEDSHSTTDSETVSYTTVVPISIKKTPK